MLAGSTLSERTPRICRTNSAGTCCAEGSTMADATLAGSPLCSASATCWARAALSNVEGVAELPGPADALSNVEGVAELPGPADAEWRVGLEEPQLTATTTAST